MRKIIFLLASLILLIGIVSAVPPMPNAFYGDVTLNNGTFPNGYFITAKVSNLDSVECTIINGKYGYGENTCIALSNQENVLVEFYICDEKIGEHVFIDKEITKLDFNLTGPLSCSPTSFCGDQTCNAGETCSTCPGDCGTCPIPTTTTPSSSGGGGGSSGGGGGGSSSGTTTLLADNTVSTSGSGGVEETSEIGGPKKENIGSGITGAVIGFVQSGAGVGVGIALVMILAGVGILTIRKNKLSKEQSL